MGLASAQTKMPTPPAGMTQQEFNALVDAISNAVVEKLKKEGAVTLKPAEAGKSEIAGEPDVEDAASDQAAAFVARAELALTAFPELWRNLVRVPALLDKSVSGGRGLVAFLVTLWPPSRRHSAPKFCCDEPSMAFGGGLRLA